LLYVYVRGTVPARCRVPPIISSSLSILKENHPIRCNFGACTSQTHPRHGAGCHPKHQVPNQIRIRGCSQGGVPVRVCASARTQARLIDPKITIYPHAKIPTQRGSVYGHNMYIYIYILLKALRAVRRALLQVMIAPLFFGSLVSRTPDHFGTHFDHFWHPVGVTLAPVGPLLEHFGCTFRVTKQTGAPQVPQGAPPPFRRQRFGVMFEVIFHTFSDFWCKKTRP